MPQRNNNNQYCIRQSIDNSKEYAVYNVLYGYEVTCYRSYGAAQQGLRKLMNK